MNQKWPEDEEKFLEERGWSTWYHRDYWVHPKTIKDPSRQDYTNYGMSMEAAIHWELDGHEPWSGNYLGLRF